MNYSTESVKRLFKVISMLENEEECEKFFEDVCTIKEIQDMAQRLDTAMMLNKGASYIQISEDLKISTATISRVSRCLNYGAGGYALAMKKLGKDDDGR